MRFRVRNRDIAIQEGDAIAEMVLAACDDARWTHHDDMGGGHHDHVTPKDFQLDCRELPIRTFDAIDRIDCPNGRLSFSELAQAFTAMDPPDRLRLIQDLREPCARLRRHKGKVGPCMAVGWPCQGLLVYMSPAWQAALAVTLIVLVGALIVYGLYHGAKAYQARREIIGLLNAAL